MKRILFCFILILFLIPTFVYAQELPNHSFAYFMAYPNGKEYGVGSYDVAKENDEKLIYTDYTNSNGEVILSNWDSEGDIRIEYLEDSVNANLSQKRIELIYGLENPKTGFYYLSFIIMGIVFNEMLRKVGEDNG